MENGSAYDTSYPFTIPNIITVVGFFTALYTIIMVQEAWSFYEKFGALTWPMEKSVHLMIGALVTIATDLLDGKIARHWHLRSKLGAFLDRARDKFFVCPLIWYMYKYLQLLPNHGQNFSDLYAYLKVMVWAILIIEGALIIGGLIAAVLNWRVASARSGKWKMAMECLAVSIWIFAFLFLTPAGFFTHWTFKIFVATLAISTILAAVSFMSYLASWFNGAPAEAAA